MAEVENIMTGYDQLQDAVVYGVEIPNTNGRAGMASITLHEGQAIDSLDVVSLYQFLKANIKQFFLPQFCKQSIWTARTFMASNKLPIIIDTTCVEELSESLPEIKLPIKKKPTKSAPQK